MIPFINITKKRITLCIMLFVSSICANAQQINVVSEISWNAFGVNYTGLMVTLTDNTGIFVVDYYHSSVGYVRVVQSVNVRNEYDMWGNCTTYLFGYDAIPSEPVLYSPDSFVIFPNGTMFTQDSAGVWSTAIIARIVPQYEWDGAFRKYGLDD
ncbi:MAG: hypothetical protein MJ000_09125 [Bacteroidales bacterium]|nr:hypothetical protein [Bacteroidales bacterium]